MNSRHIRPPVSAARLLGPVGKIGTLHADEIIRYHEPCFGVRSFRIGGLGVALLVAPLLTGISFAGPQPRPTFLAGITGAACPSGTIRIKSTQNIQTVVDQEPPGTLFCISGRHRAETIAPKDNQSFFGEAGSVLDGTVLLENFNAEGLFWATTSQAPPSTPHGVCLATTSGCSRPELVLMDGKPLARVLDVGQLRPGKFFINSANQVVIADNPTGHEVEESAAAYAFLSHSARNVTVSNLTIEKYGNPAQRAAVFNEQDPNASGWLIEHNDVQRNSGLGVLVGMHARVVANQITENGQLGLSANLEGGVITGNEISGNNTRGFDPSWEAGGFKAAVAKGLSVRENFSHDNHGPGLWCDIECRDVLFEGNIVENNDGPGIFYEISFDGIIRDNLTRNNGRSNTGWYWDANILIAASQSVLVERNAVDVAEGGVGIALIDQGRRRESGGLYKTANNRIVGNDIRFQGTREARMGAVSDVSSGSPNDGIIERGKNNFDGNHYVAPNGSQVVFGWGRQSLNFPEFQAAGQDRSSTMQRAGE